MRFSHCFCLALAGFLFAAAPAFAQSSVPAKEVRPPAGLSGAVACYEISSRLGWQSIRTRARPAAWFEVVSPTYNPKAYASGWPAPKGWSVDGARYKGVGPQGHQGRDAEALAPFAKYKFASNLPFGALLLRDDNERTYAMRDRVFGVPPDRNLLLRINDSDEALGDNTGFLRFCEFRRE